MSKWDFKEKIVLLTGAWGGLGREFTKQLLKAGAFLILTDIDEKELKSATNEILSSVKNSGGKILKIIGAALSTERGCIELFNKSREASKNFDCIIFNAGKLLYGNFHTVPQEKWEALISVNLLAPMRLTYLFLPDMLSRKEGRMVYICSIAGIVGTTQSVSYSASKFGLRGFAISLAEEIKKSGVKVTVVYPSWIDTPLLKTTPYGSLQPKTLQHVYVYPPEKIVKKVLTAVKKGKREVFPGLMPKIINFVNKFSPVVGSQRLNV